MFVYDKRFHNILLYMYLYKVLLFYLRIDFLRRELLSSIELGLPLLRLFSSILAVVPLLLVNASVLPKNFCRIANIIEDLCPVAYNSTDAGISSAINSNITAATVLIEFVKVVYNNKATCNNNPSEQSDVTIVNLNT